MNHTFQEAIEISQKMFNAYEKLNNFQKKTYGITPYNVVLEIDKLRLLQFVSDTPKQNKPPLLISYALVNRYTIADLRSGKSLVQKLLDAGLDVYVMDWGYPDDIDHYLDLEDYVFDYIDSCVDHILNEHQIDQLNLLGICQGGTLSVCYTASFPEKVKNLITMVTPIDFQTPDDILSHMVRKIDVDEFVGAYGNISGQYLNANFGSLMPTTLNIMKWLSALDSLADHRTADFFLSMEAWIQDSPDQAGKAYQEFLTYFYQQNLLLKQQLKIADNTIDTKQITQPVLNIFGLQDHLVPPASSMALKSIIGSQSYTELPVDTGHIGMYVSGRAKAVPEQIVSWLNQN